MPLRVDQDTASRFARTIFDPASGFQNLGACVGFAGYRHVLLLPVDKLSLMINAVCRLRECTILTPRANARE
jgi:hypothetical protein